MNNLILFLNEFISYVIVFAIFIAVMIIAGVIGVSIRKMKNKKSADTVSEETAVTSGD